MEVLGGFRGRGCTRRVGGCDNTTDRSNVVLGSVMNFRLHSKIAERGILFETRVAVILPPSACRDTVTLQETACPDLRCPHTVALSRYARRPCRASGPIIYTNDGCC